MTSMPHRYQLRCGLLEAAHYGTPQHRVRFFLIAAKRGLELPPFPQPTHDIPHPDKLEIRFPEEHILRPITTLPGVAPHRYVSVHDAIGDLPKFEWYDPTFCVRVFLNRLPRRKAPEEILSRREMNEKRVKECLENMPWCGYSGPNVAYEHEPHTSYQRRCRSRPTRDIQHYSRTYPHEKVKRQVIRAIATVWCAETIFASLESSGLMSDLMQTIAVRSSPGCCCDLSD